MGERENWDVLCEVCDKTIERGVSTESSENYCDSCYNKLAYEKSEKPVVINIPPVEEWPMKELKYVCKHNKVKGYTKMNREQLVQHVKEIVKQMKSE